MALTEIQIANLALVQLGNTNLLGGTTISGLPAAGEPTFTIEAQQATTLYAHCRDSALRDFPWNVGLKLAEMTLLRTSDGTQPWAGRWTYEYRYPTDALWIRAIRFPGEAKDNPKPNKYEISSDNSDRVVWCDVAVPDDVGDLNGAMAEYTFAPSVAIYSDDPQFVLAFTALLAFKMGPGLAADMAKVAAAWQFYNIVKLQAQRADANESETGEEVDGSFTVAHRGG